MSRVRSATGLWASATRAHAQIGAAAVPGSRLGTQASDSVAELSRGYATDLTSFKNKALKAGPGGRSSVSGLRAVIFGSTGFLGRYVVNKLAQSGTQCVLPVRCEHWDTQHLMQMGDIGQTVIIPDISPRNKDQVLEMCDGANLVINLLGIHQETWNFGFREVHVDFARTVAEAAAETSTVERMLHLSSLGASPRAPSERLKTKWDGELAVKTAYPGATIFRPAPMTGSEDKLFNNYAFQAKRLPVFPLINGGKNKMQPVFVVDVADAMYQSLTDSSHVGQTYTLCGPKVYTVKELAEFTFNTIREEAFSVSVPPFVAEAMAMPRDFINKRIPPLMFNFMASADHAKESVIDFVMPEGEPGLDALGVKPTKVDEGLAIEYLRFYRSGGYDLGTVAGGQS
mmetsp:Transcript_31177/g.88409  ORF Transcript_31177/g.88409 Transcript_31177/m.88409 type:complete len:399 (+) Transcript_31177:143-1339(+)